MIQLQGNGKSDYSSLLLGSKEALRLVDGRLAEPDAEETWKRSEVIGLLKYAQACIRLCRHSSNDNPYADVALLGVEKKIEVAEDFIEKQQQKLDKLMQSKAVTSPIMGMQNSEPVKVSFEFSDNHYAAMGAKLLVMYDALVIKANSARSSGLISRKVYDQFIWKAGHKIRGLFVLPGQMPDIYVTRDDLSRRSEVAKQAIEKMGDIDQKVMAKELSPLWNLAKHS